MSNLPSQASPSYASDEDVLIRAGGDFATLVPPWQVMATGTDGVFVINAPWVLTSTAVDFEAQGVSPNQVVWLEEPKTYFKGGGQFLAVDSVDGNTCTLRRPHQDLNVGQPPAPVAGLTGVKFTVPTLDPQIEEASYEIRRRFAIDENNFSRSSSYIYDLRELRSATVLMVLLDRYTFENRTNSGDFSIKMNRVRMDMEMVLGRIQIRWGQTGASQEPSTLFGTRLSR